MFASSLLKGPFIEPFAPDTGEAWYFAYARRDRGRYQHIVALKVAPGLDDTLTASLLRSMRNNEALKGLVRGKHYQWAGISTVVFRSKEASSLFLIFLMVEPS